MIIKYKKEITQEINIDYVESFVRECGHFQLGFSKDHAIEIIRLAKVGYRYENMPANILGNMSEVRVLGFSIDQIKQMSAYCLTHGGKMPWREG
jgi:hypothetical protein